MNREILFRGKTIYSKIDKAKAIGSFWIEGLLRKLWSFEKEDYLYYIDTTGFDITCDAFLVDPKTIGQYTGLKDIDGNKIFEGDVCIGKWKNTREVIFDDGSFGVQSFKHGSFDILEKGSIELYQIKIIGNIFDKEVTNE